MPSFSKTSVFPAGYFRATSAWLLRERRDVVARLTTLGAEMTRIGFVTMHYRKIKQGESTLATEQRMGFSVTAGSSLARLVQAYIATGGNPFNISGFLHPETSSFEAQADGDVAVSQDYPGGGVYSAMSAEYNEPHVKSTAEVSPSGDVVSVGDSDANETDPEADEGEVTEAKKRVEAVDLMPPELRPLIEELGLPFRPSSWVPEGTIVVVPKDRTFVGVVNRATTKKLAGVVHNAARGIAIAQGTPPDELAGSSLLDPDAG